LGEPDFLDEKDVSPDICGDVSVGLLDVLKCEIIQQLAIFTLKSILRLLTVF